MWRLDVLVVLERYLADLVWSYRRREVVVASLVTWLRAVLGIRLILGLRLVLLVMMMMLVLYRLVLALIIVIILSWRWYILLLLFVYCVWYFRWIDSLFRLLTFSLFLLWLNNIVSWAWFYMSSNFFLMIVGLDLWI